MKAVAIALISALIAGAGGYYFASAKSRAAIETATAAAEAKWQQERADLEAQLARSKGRAATVSTPSAAVPSAPPVVVGEESPEQIIARLQTIRVASGPAGQRAIRKVVHEMEKLVDIGEGSLPAIATFLRSFQDVDYLVRDEERENEGQDGGGRGATASSFGGADNPVFSRRAALAPQFMAQRAAPESGQEMQRGPRREGGGLRAELERLDARALLQDVVRGPRRVRLDFTVPPSLRIGLFDVLHAIGGSGAESLLAEMLNTTGRPVEVAYLAKTLEQMRQGAYRDPAIATAKELLLQPPVIPNPGRLDENAKGYLFHVLAMFNDNSFATIAPDLLITAEGRLDRTTFDYLRSLKEHGVPGLVQAYNDARLTNLTEKASIANAVLGYAGPNPQANALFHQILQDETINDRMRALTMMRLMREEDGPEMARQRIPLVQQAKNMTRSETISRSADMAVQALTSIANGERVDMGAILRGAGGMGGERGRPTQQPPQGERRR